MHRFRSWIGIILAAVLIVVCLTPQMRTVLTLPDYQRMVVGESSHINISLPGGIGDRLVMQVLGAPNSVFSSREDPAIIVNKQANGYRIVALNPGKANVQLKLLGYIPVKSITVETLPTRRVVPGGHSIGVLLQSRGIMVVGFAPVTGQDGKKLYPARDEGIEIGDLILKANGTSVKTENDLARVIDANGAEEKVRLTIKRRDNYLTVAVKTAPCPETGRKRIGLYVRDGIVGVGTLTFWDPESKRYAALGHIIVDADTRQGVDVLQGRIVSASVQTIKSARPGQPGEKIGVFNGSGPIEGTIVRNSPAGIFGQTSVDLRNPYADYSLEVGYAHQVREGKAQIYTVVSGDQIEKFDVTIEKVYPERQNGKGMIIRVTDPRLLNLTGGIVQGMSGSPIVQDSRIVGAVTHVFLHDPERGYGIFMDNMMSEMETLPTHTGSRSTNRVGA